jgi:diphosphoinositol-polyphosphate diphosphatase
VIPKGGVETDEADYESAAVRETWEEAGVKGKIVKSLGVIEDMRPPKNWGSMDCEDPITGVIKHPPRSEFHIFEMIAEEEFEIYPESDKRKRKWFSYKKAIEKINENKRPELAYGIEKSSLKR